MEVDVLSNTMLGAISCLDVSAVRPILCCLERMSLIAPLDQSTTCLEGRTSGLQVLVNSIVALLFIDFHARSRDRHEDEAAAAVEGWFRLL